MIDLTGFCILADYNHHILEGTYSHDLIFDTLNDRLNYHNWEKLMVQSHRGCATYIDSVYYQNLIIGENVYV